MSRKKMFGGNGKPQGDAEQDPIGTVRRSPDGSMLAVKWPSPPSKRSWGVTDWVGSLGYELPERIVHWPIVGAVPFSPAAGVPLLNKFAPQTPATVTVELPERSAS
jgi:hypothetical protein